MRGLFFPFWTSLLPPLRSLSRVFHPEDTRAHTKLRVGGDSERAHHLSSLMEWTVEIVFPFQTEFQLQRCHRIAAKNPFSNVIFISLVGCIYCPESSFPGCVLPWSSPVRQDLPVRQESVS